MPHYAILGPLELTTGARRVSLEGRRKLGLLVVLLLHANEVVAADALVDAVWRDSSPEGAHKRLRMTIARLRETLAMCGEAGSSPLRTVRGGYVLEVREGELDVDVFDSAVRDGRRALAAGDARRAARGLRGALALWRGPALADVGYEDWAQPEIRRLEELRLVALQARIDADLQLGGHAALVGELEDLVARHPTHERFAEQLMVALYRCGRQADALDVFGRARLQLSTQLGLAPGPRLRALQSAVLAQSPSLELAPELTPPTPPGPHDGSGATIHLPARPTGMLGRDADVSELIDLLLGEDVRLVTIMGTGGVGKTTIAADVAHRLAADFSDGAAFVDLAALDDAGDVADAVLHALGHSPDPGEPSADALCRLAAPREQLIVLDNFEHLIGAGTLLVGLLAAAPRLTLLVTSRVALNLRAEHRYQLHPLELPASTHPATVAAAPATALFIARATARDRAFELTPGNVEAVARVCTRLGGLPLAIELTAAHAGTLSPQEIAELLESALITLGRGARDVPDRQRTLRSTLDWSHALLDDAQRATFAGLSVFAGGCTIDAARQVTASTLDVLESLVDHSLLTRRATPEGATRLAMLEPIREYAAERLAAEPADAAQVLERHSRYYLTLAEAIRPKLVAADQRSAQRCLDREADNFQDVLARARRAGNAERLLRLAAALQNWWRRGRGSAGRAWIEQGLALPADLPADVHADALTTAAVLCAQQGDITRGATCAEGAIALYETSDDAARKTVALVTLAVCKLVLGDARAARAVADEAARCAGDAGGWPLGYALVAQALTAPDPGAATPIAARAAQLLHNAGDIRAQAWLFGDLGYKALEHHAFDEAHELIARSLELSDRLDDHVHHTFDLGHMALWALLTGHDGSAAEWFGTALTHCARYGVRRPIPEALVGVATLAAHDGHATRAAELLGAASELRGNEPMSAIEARLHADIVERAAGTDGPAWERAYNAGRRHDLDEAVALGRQTAHERVAAPASLPDTSITGSPRSPDRTAFD